MESLSLGGCGYGNYHDEYLHFRTEYYTTNLLGTLQYTRLLSSPTWLMASILLGRSN